MALNRFARVTLPLAGAAGVLALFAGSATNASAACRWTAWRVIAQTLTMREYPGGPAFTTMHYNDQVVGPTGQGGKAWVYVSGLHRHGNPWQTTHRAGYVLHSYLDYEYTGGC